MLDCAGGSKSHPVENRVMLPFCEQQQGIDPSYSNLNLPAPIRQMRHTAAVAQIGVEVSVKDRSSTTFSVAVYRQFFRSVRGFMQLRHAIKRQGLIVGYDEQRHRHTLPSSASQSPINGARRKQSADELFARLLISHIAVLRDRHA